MRVKAQDKWPNIYLMWFAYTLTCITKMLHILYTHYAQE